jgi:gas vesicle protein
MDFDYIEQGTTSWRAPVLLFVAGTAIGAAAALAMAPATGRETREFVRRRSSDFARTVSEQADRVSSAMKAGRDQAAAIFNDTVDTAAEQARAAYHTVKSASVASSMPSSSRSSHSPS